MLNHDISFFITVSRKGDKFVVLVERWQNMNLLRPGIISLYVFLLLKILSGDREELEMLRIFYEGTHPDSPGQQGLIGLISNF